MNAILLLPLFVALARANHASSDELGLARIANARVGRFGPVHAEPAFINALQSSTPVETGLVFLTIVSRLNSPHLALPIVERLTTFQSQSPTPALFVVALGSSARIACEGLQKGKQRVVCIRGTHLDSEDAGMNRLALEASLELATAHYVLNCLSLDRSVLFVDLSRVRTLELKDLPTLLSRSLTDGRHQSDLSYFLSISCAGHGARDKQDDRQGLAILQALPSPAASRCIYDWMVYMWLKRKGEITSDSFSKVVPGCLSSVDGSSVDLSKLQKITTLRGTKD